MGNFLDFVNKKQESVKADNNQLNPQELEYLLSVLKVSTLRGDQIELFYSLVVKLQNQYLELTSKK